MCETRWVKKHTAFTGLSQLYEPILPCLEGIWFSLSDWSNWSEKAVKKFIINSLFSNV